MENFAVKEDREIAERFKNIPGWGIDADPDDKPNYPIKNYTGDDYERLDYNRPEMQSQTVEVLHSIERPGLTCVYGTSVPPSGLSGMVRRFAFKYSESTYSHWVPLILADRINVVEGIIDDLRQGIIPNIFAEKGWKAEWKYNRQGMIKNIAIGVAVTAGIVMLLSRKKARR
jgi:hypothetical protein